MPREIAAEIDHLPTGFLDRLIEARHYTRAYHIVKANPGTADTSALVQKVKAMRFELVQDGIDAQKKP